MAGGLPGLTVHVLEAVDPAAAIVEFAEANQVDHIIISDNGLGYKPIYIY